MAPSEIATVVIVLVLVVERLLERRDRRREQALRDAEATGDLRKDYIGALEGRVERLETAVKARDKTIEAMRMALRWFFDEMAASDRCKRAAAGCTNRIAPGSELPEDRLTEIRALLDEQHGDVDDVAI